MYNRCPVLRTVRVDAMYTFFDSVFQSEHYFDGESHDFYEAVCVLDGRAGVTADSQLLVLSEGQMIIHPPMVFHKIWSADNSTPHVINFAFDGNLGNIESGTVFHMSEKCRDMICALSNSLGNVFDIGTYSLNSVKSGAEEEAQMWVMDMERFLLSAMTEVVKKGKNHVARNNYTKIISVMEQNLDKPLRLSHLAKLCGMSGPGLEKTFSRYAGMGVMRYYNYLKMQKASAMLRGGCSVKEAAFAVGFNDQNYFSFTFKNIVGMSPSHVRRI